MNKSNTANIEYLSPKESEEKLEGPALDLIDHIIEILAADYVETVKQHKEEKNS